MFLKRDLLLNGKERECTQRPVRRLLVEVRNDERLDNSSSSESGELLDLKYIFKTEIPGVNWKSRCWA